MLWATLRDGQSKYFYSVEREVRFKFSCQSTDKNFELAESFSQRTLLRRNFKRRTIEIFYSVERELGLNVLCQSTNRNLNTFSGGRPYKFVSAWEKLLNDAHNIMYATIAA